MAAVAARAVPVPPGPLGRVWAVLAWQAVAYKRTWRATLTVSFLDPILFLVALGAGLGQLVSDDAAGLGGLSYLEFVGPGLLAAGVMSVAVNEATMPIEGGLRWLRTYHAVVSTPVAVGELVAGHLAWLALRVAVAATVFGGVLTVAGVVDSPLALLIVPVAVLLGLAFATPIEALVAWTTRDGVIPALQRFVIVPLFLFSGTFFPVSQLPGWLSPVAAATPLYHGVQLCRGLASGTAELGPSLGHVAYLAVLAAVGWVLAVRAHARKLLA